MSQAKLITVVEVPPFPGQADSVWSNEERHRFIDFIARNPLAGDEIPGTGGLRKVRWNRQGMGKRSGVRVVYFFYNDTAPVFLFTVYAKGKQTDLSTDEKKKMTELARILKVKIRIGR